MIQPLYATVLVEVVVILLLLFRTPLRNPLLMLLDRLKQGQGPIVLSTAGAVLFVIMATLLFNINRMRDRSEEGGGANQTDQVVHASQLLQASLLGFALFLALMIDRIHYYIKEVRMLRKHLEAIKKTDRTPDGVTSKGKGTSKVTEEED